MNDAFQDVRDATSEWFGHPESIVPLEGGANNVGLRVVTPGRTVFAKKYFSDARDTRDRLGAEFGMLSFLWRNGMRCIPEPLAADRARRIGFYEYVEGPTPPAGTITGRDVAAMSALLGDMWKVRLAAGASALPLAADAARCVNDYIECVRVRMAAACACADLGDQPREFPVFVKDRLGPAFESLQDAVRRMLQSSGLDPGARLSDDEMTLSPADHGFHNTLRRADGSLVFLDFEYAGWDDPAQMICNACLQPRVPMEAGQIPSFLRDVFGRVEGSRALSARLRVAYALLGFKWALIMLNEFLPVGRDRRRFAGTDPERRRSGQLDKAGRQLLKVEAYTAAGGLFDGLQGL
jgi:hypothetical protein